MIHALTSPNLAAPHGFFTRSGGVSEGIYASLNCGPGSGDDLAKVKENRARVAKALGASMLITAHQCHSATAVIAKAAWDVPPEADAIVTKLPGLAVGVLTADCGPILFADAKAGVVAAAHAGWKGALSGIVESTVAAMESLGAKRKNISAVLGPCIAQKSYEVGQEFYDRFLADNPANATYFISGNAPEKHFFNLKYYINSKLQASDIKNIAILNNNTLTEEETFFSFRRTTLRGESAYGRQISAIVLEK